MILVARVTAFVALWCCLPSLLQAQWQIHLTPKSDRLVRPARPEPNSSGPVVAAAGVAQIEARGLSDSDLFEVTGAEPEELASFLRLYVKESLVSGSRQPVLGEVSVEERSVVFRPRFPLEAGVTYVAQFQCDSAQSLVSKEFVIPKPSDNPSTRVATVYPTAEVLPQNLLKFYLHFSAPMSQGDAYNYIELKTENGRLLEHPFLEIEEELWDASGKRLTLLLDPGRVKRGLVPREEDGAILDRGGKYQLCIKSQWPDARGVPLVQGVVKRFTVGPEDFTQPDPTNWRIVAPHAQTLEALTLEFPEPLDHATVSRGITLENGNGDVVRGEFTFTRQETRAHFKPFKEWRSGLYDLRISTLIEDLSGNSIQRAFEVDRFDRVDQSAPERRTIVIEVR